MMDELTPIKTHGGFRVKRDDLYEIAGVYGGKARACWNIAHSTTTGLVTAGSRSSPQVNIVAHIAHHLGIPCRVHTPAGAKTPELLDAESVGAELVQHRPGHNTVIIARAREDAKARGWVEIPFGMQHELAVECTAIQVANLPKRGRIVVPVGSGISLAGILQGLHRYNRSNPVLGIMVGANPTRRLDTYAGMWRYQNLRLVPAGVDYHTEVEARLGSLILDPIYEAKCVPFLEAGDILWVVGIRNTVKT